MAEPDGRAGRAPPVVYLTLDVEPDYGRSNSLACMDKAGPFFDWVRAESIPLTAFVVGSLLERGHRVVDRLLEQGIPIAVHGYTHGAGTLGTMRTSHEDEIRRGFEAASARLGRRPAGYRAAAGIISRADLTVMASLGLRYDASVFPLRRPGRYDFRRLPRTPFRWGGTGLVEIPFGLLAPAAPAGMTFLNLAGPWLGPGLVMRAARGLPGSPAWYVVDVHLHNLFSNFASMRGLPAGLSAVYLAGAFAGGFRVLRRIVESLRTRGIALGNLESAALRLAPAALPEVGPDVFDGPEAAAGGL